MVPLTIPLLLAMPFGPFMSWKRGDLVGVMQRLLTALGLAIAVGFTVYVIKSDGPVLAPLGIAVGIWMVVGSISEVLWRAKAFQTDFSKTLHRLRHLPRASYGAALGHAGMGITVLGAVAVTAYGTEVFEEMKPGQTIETGGYTMTFKTIRPERHANYVQDVGVFDVRKNGTLIGQLEPAKRVYPARQFPTTESSIATYGFSQLYMSLGDVQQDGTAVVRAYWKPYVTLIWYGTILMFIGGGLSLADRRLRIGVPTRKKLKAASMQPAE